MRKLKKFRSVAILCCAMLVTFSCDDEFLAEGNPSAPSVANSFANLREAEASVFAIYAGLQENESVAREWWWLVDTLSDELKSAGPQLEAGRAQILNYDIDASSGLISQAWLGLYRIIHRSNLVINTLPDKVSDQLSQADVNLLVGEAKFLRAWAYFELVTYWGNVPFTLETVEDFTGGVPMADSEETIRIQILEDLAAAEAALPSVTAYRGTNNLGRVTKGTAQTLLGRAYMYFGDFVSARTALQKVIDSGDYALAPNYEDNHREETENNIESIFEVQFERVLTDVWGGAAKAVQYRTQEYTPFIWHNVVPSDELVAAFEEGDPRYKLCFLEYGDLHGPNNEDVFTQEDIAQGIANGVHWKKYGYDYQVSVPEMFSGINLRMLRYADVLLMMAEIENEQNGPTGLALDYVNQVRSRAGVPDLPTAEYPTSSKDQMFNAIVHERRVELNSEQARTRDVKRWFRDGKVGPPSPNYEPRHEFLPIPLDEMDNNPALTPADQKPGY
ncbi:MAG: RagB/SusD family nutrient uptake outer membrane protein [Pricia sp.]